MEKSTTSSDAGAANVSKRHERRRWTARGVAALTGLAAVAGCTNPAALVGNSRQEASASVSASAGDHTAAAGDQRHRQGKHHNRRKADSQPESIPFRVPFLNQGTIMIDQNGVGTVRLPLWQADGQKARMEIDNMTCHPDGSLSSHGYVVVTLGAFGQKRDVKFDHGSQTIAPASHRRPQLCVNRADGHARLNPALKNPNVLQEALANFFFAGGLEAEHDHDPETRAGHHTARPGSVASLSPGGAFLTPPAGPSQQPLSPLPVQR